jgi:predicted RND superfamily exporter protein
VFRIRGKRKESGRKNPIDRFLAGVAGMQVRRPGLVLMGVLIITVLIMPGFGLVFLDTDDENWLPEQDDVVDSLGEVGTNFGGTDSMNLIFVIDRSQEGDIDQRSIRDLRDPRILKPMATFDNVLAELEWVDAIESPTNDIKAINQDRIPQDFEQVKALIEDNPDIKSKFSDDFSISRVTIRFDDMGRREFYEVMREMESVKFPREVTVIPQGGVPEDIELEQSLSSDTTRTTMFGFLFVITTASLLYMSFVAGLLAFIPIIVAIIWTIGTMGYITLPFTVLTTGMLAILMGMGIDFSIHIIHSVKAKMEEYGDIAKALPEALMSTGQAISITTITTVAGFLVLSLATLMNTKRLGWTLALGILATFFSCILIVPSVLALQYKLKARRTRG